MNLRHLRDALAERDLDALLAQLTDDVVVHSPVIENPGFEGRGSVKVLLELAFGALSDVECTHELSGGGAHALVADARLLGKPIKGMILLEPETDGKVREVWLMVRPFKGAAAIAKLVGTELARRRGRGQGPATLALSQPLIGAVAAANLVGSLSIAILNRSTASDSD